MKKKLLMVLLAAVMTFGATGCSEEKESSKEIEETKEDEDDDEDKEEDEEEEDEEDSKDKEDKDNDDTDADDADDKTDVAMAGMIGTEFDENYDEFEYLYMESLVYEFKEYDDDGEAVVLDSQQLNVFIPEGEYTSVNGDRAYADEMGLSFKVTLNPYLSYDQDSQTAVENMEIHMKYQYDPFYCVDFKDLVISDIEGDRDSARATANFCYYDKWSDTYIPIYCTYYLTRLSDDMLVLVETEVVAEDVTGETEDLIAELETFYGFDIEWDEEEAQQKLDDYLANGVTDTISCSTGYMMFELPKGWDMDYSYGEATTYAYAPDGDFASAGCVISFTREYMGMDEFEASSLLDNEEMVKSMFTDENGELICDEYEVNAYGETCLGEAVEIKIKASEENFVLLSRWYVITDEDGYFYMIEATKIDACETDVFTMTENILANSVVRED